MPDKRGSNSNLFYITCFSFWGGRGRADVHTVICIFIFNGYIFFGNRITELMETLIHRCIFIGYIFFGNRINGDMYC